MTVNKSLKGRGGKTSVDVRNPEGRKIVLLKDPTKKRPFHLVKGFGEINLNGTATLASFGFAHGMKHLMSDEDVVLDMAMGYESVLVRRN